MSSSQKLLDMTTAGSIPIDLKATEITGIQIGHQGHKLWVCVDGICVLRIVSPKIELTDMRKSNEPMTAIEAAKYIGVGVAVFRNLVNRGQIKGVIINGVRRYTREELDNGTI